MVHRSFNSTFARTVVLGLTGWLTANVVFAQGQPPVSVPKATQAAENWGPYNAGVSAANEQRWNDAIAEFKKAIEADAKDADAHFQLGRAYLASAHQPEAKQYPAVELPVCARSN